MLKIIIWGTGKRYDYCVNILRYMEAMQEISIIGVTSDDHYYSSLDGIRFISKNEIKYVNCDYIIVTSSKFYDEICNEGVSLGISCDKFIHSDVLFLYGFSFYKYVRLMKSRISIISNNCWGGVTYHYLHMKFQSPFINMFFDDEEYLKLLCNLKEYLKLPLEYHSKEFNSVEKFEYPVFKLADVKIHMNHYHSIEAGEKAWYERLKRINWDNLFIMMYTQSRTVAKEFSELPYKKKICFVDFDEIEHPAIMPVKPFMRRGDSNRKLWEYVLDMAGGRMAYYDVWSLLLDGMKKYRIE